MNLMTFGLEILEYANEKNCYKNFVKKFNEYFGLPLDNVTATNKELLLFSLISSKKQYKEWAKSEFTTLLTEDNTSVERERIDMSNIIPNLIVDSSLEQMIDD